MKILTALEFSVILVSIIYGAKWVIDPSGDFEPIIAFCAILIASIDIGRRHYKKSKVPLKSPKPEKIENYPSERNPSDINKLPSFKFASSCSFFDQRFSQAFPGIREGKWFEGSQAVERLGILLEQPLKFSLPSDGCIVPVGWQRGGNMTFNDFSIIDKSTVLIDSKELKVKRIYAGFMPNYKQLFVYLEAEEMPVIGLYEKTNEDFEEILKCFGYVWEEYGLYKGTHPISRAEYDDNAAIIMGKPVSLGGESKIRTRYISPYNMIISASASSLNQPLFDEILESYMNRLLKNEDCIEEFMRVVKKLPSQ